MTTPRLPVDFNSADDERTIRLTTRGTLEALREQGFTLQEGMEIFVTDDELLLEQGSTGEVGYGWPSLKRG